jgi:hypothetical protein
VPAKVLRFIRRAISSRLFVFLFVVAVFGLLSGGRLKRSADATFYIALSDAVQHRTVATFLTSKQANFSVVVFPALLAVVRTASPTYWEPIILALNVICAGITAVLLVSMVRMVTGSLAAAAVALFLYLVCFDIFLWVSWLLTDTIYTAIALTAYVLSVRGIFEGEGTQRWRRVKLFLAVIVATMTRPVGFILIPIVALTEWLFVGLPKKLNRRWSWTLFFAAVTCVFLVHAYFFQDMTRWPVKFMQPKLQELAAREKAGEVVMGRTETAHRPPVSMAGHVMIEVDRFFRFFQATSSQYSFVHNILSLPYYAALYLLALIGVVDGARNGDARRKAVIDTALLWVLATAALAAATSLDFDFRYRLPLMPQIILLGCCGVDALMRRYALREPQVLMAQSPLPEPVFSDRSTR